MPELPSQFHYRIPKQKKASTNKIGKISCNITLNEYKGRKRNMEKSS